MHNLSKVVYCSSIKCFFRSKSLAGYPHKDNSGVRTISAEYEYASAAALSIFFALPSRSPTVGFI